MVVRLDYVSRQHSARFLLEELQDEELVSLILCHTQVDAAFAELVNRYETSFLSVARKLVKSEAEAQDVVQSAFLNIFNKLNTFREGSSFKNWAYRIVTNCGLMRLRRKKVRQECNFDAALPTGLSDHQIFELDVAPSWSARPDQIYSSQQISALIDDAVEQLPAIYKDVFVLKEFEGLSLKEIEEQLDLSVPAIKSRLHRARHHLKVALERDIDF